VRRLVDSLGAAVVGYIAASFAGGFSYVFLLAAAIQITGAIAEPSEISAAAQLMQLVWFAVMATILIAIVSFIPTIPVLAILILARRTDIVSFIVAGILIGVAGVMIARRNVLFMDKLEVDWVIVSASAIAGIAFWAVMKKMAPKPAVPA
jgi:hypothetical protein